MPRTVMVCHNLRLAVVAALAPLPFALFLPRVFFNFPTEGPAGSREYRAGTAPFALLPAAFVDVVPALGMARKNGTWNDAMVDIVTGCSSIGSLLLLQYAFHWRETTYIHLCDRPTLPAYRDCHPFVVVIVAVWTARSAAIFVLERSQRRSCRALLGDSEA